MSAHRAVRPPREPAREPANGLAGELARLFEQELPRVNACICAEVEALDELIRPLAAHVLGSGGKRLRPLLTLLFARLNGHGDHGDHTAAGGDCADIYPLATSLEFLHTATLLHDDILDEAATRRGRAAAHTVYGVVPAVLGGDVLLALANLIASRYGDARLTAIMAKAIMRTATGEVAELAALGKGGLSQDAYLQIIMGKTAYLIQAACELGAVVAEADDEAVARARDYGLNLGIAFQLVDDALDYLADPAVSGKPRGGDLSEGKFTPPLIGYLQATGDDGTLAARIGAGVFADPAHADEAEAIIAGVVEGGHATATREEAAVYGARALQALGRVPADGSCPPEDAGPEVAALCEAVTFVLAREK